MLHFCSTSPHPPGFKSSVRTLNILTSRKQRSPCECTTANFFPKRSVRGTASSDTRTHNPRVGGC